MSDDDLRRIAVAAADKEAVEFELDHADLTLKEAVVVALEHGAPPEMIAEAADLEPEEVLDLAHTVEEPALLVSMEFEPSTMQQAPSPTTLPSTAQDAN